MTIKDLKHIIKDLDDDMPIKVYGSKNPSEPTIWTLVSEDGYVCLMAGDGMAKVSLHGGDLYEG